MRVAVADFGSQATRFMVADILSDGTIKEVARERLMTSLGNDLKRFGEGYLLSEAGEAKLLDVSSRFANFCVEHDIQRYKVVATDFLRAADNGSSVRQRVLAATGLDLQVITGKQEGELSHQGACLSLPVEARKLPVLVIDLGGGSLELAYGVPGNEVPVISLPLGALRIASQFLVSDPARADERMAAFRYCLGHFKSAASQLGLPRPPVTTLLVGGAAFDFGQACQSQVITPALLAPVASKLSTTTLHGRSYDPIWKGRAEGAVAAAVIFQACFAALGLEEATVSSTSILEALCLEAAAL